MNFLHALASVTALVTMLLFLARQRCGLAKLSKHGQYELSNTIIAGIRSRGLRDKCAMLYRSPALNDGNFFDTLEKPKYKRDPEIHIDDEIITVHPRETEKT